MVDIIHELERLSFRTLPALEQERYNGWVLRWSDGGSRRANSVNPVAGSDASIAEMIDYCEAWFAERNAPTVFRLTELAPDSLQDRLQERGYEYAAPTDVMTAPIGESAPAERVEVADRPSIEWLRTISSLPPDSPRLQKLAVQLTTSGGLTRFAAVHDDGDIVSIGLGIDLDRYTTIYNMNTVPTARRSGHARRILETILALGRSSGSTHAVLQVTQDNVAGQALYRNAGFVPVYEYSYMEAPS